MYFSIHRRKHRVTQIPLSYDTLSKGKQFNQKWKCFGWYSLFLPDIHTQLSSSDGSLFLTLLISLRHSWCVQDTSSSTGKTPSLGKMEHSLNMGNIAGMPDNVLSSVYHCTLMCFRQEVDGCVLNLSDCSLNEHLSLAACLSRPSFSLELPKGKVYIWQNEKESQIHPFLLRGMKELKSFRVTAQSEHLSLL